MSKLTFRRKGHMFVADRATARWSCTSCGGRWSRETLANDEHVFCPKPTPMDIPVDGTTSTNQGESR